MNVVGTRGYILSHCEAVRVPSIQGRNKAKGYMENNMQIKLF